MIALRERLQHLRPRRSSPPRDTWRGDRRRSRRRPPRASRGTTWRRPSTSPGISASLTLPSAVTRAFIAIRSTTPVKPASLPIGSWSGHEPALQPLLQRLERAVEVGALAVEAVDDDRARQGVLVGELPDLLRLHLHARHRVHHHDRGARHAQPRARVGDEVAVPGRVDQVEAVALVVAEGDRGVQRDLALDLVGVEVGGGGAVVHLAEPGGGPACEQDRLDQGGLAHAAVAHERDVADLGDVHAYLLGRKKDDAVSVAGMLPQRYGAFQPLR